MAEPWLVCDDEADDDEQTDYMNSATPSSVLADVLPPGPVPADWSSSKDQGQQPEKEDREPGTSSGQIRYPHSCGKCYNDCLNRLTTLCDSEEVLDFNHALKPSFRGTKIKKIAETMDNETFILVTGHKTQTPVDTVVQLYAIDPHTASRVYCNLFTSKKLSDLHKSTNNKCFGFRILRRIIFVKDTLPENFAKAYEEFGGSHSHSCSYHPHPGSRPKVQRYMLVESDYSGDSILRSKIKPSQAISILGQVACCLAVAERELQFEHRNLHEDNIMVLPSSFKNQHFLIDGRTYCVKGSGLKITLLDDNFSRITCDNEVVMRMKDYNRVYKKKTPIYITMESIIKDKWEAFYPETNARWLAYLCGHLRDYLAVPNPTGDLQRKLELLAYMERDLQKYHSAEDGREYEPRSWLSAGPSPAPARSHHAGLFSFLRRRHKGDDKKTPPTDSPADATSPAQGCSYSPRTSATSSQHHGQQPR
ncbi:hypothetical protein HPB50_016161 [Hyalomma asiaticum]|uniref:Uncharacterized protein n=1 Tax=Hyalomma asiaticum TaxID=266040 RepID=A0ACB7SMY7_HYAAI|nr:hypothetical protein HPB50_016161 [Hyalomma asiaticum]